MKDNYILITEELTKDLLMGVKRRALDDSKIDVANLGIPNPISLFPKAT